MARSIAAAVVGCLYVAGSVWMVHSAGQAYRNGLIKPKLAASKTETSTLVLSEKRDQNAPLVAISEASSSGPPPAGLTPAQAKTGPSANTTAEQASPTRPMVELAKAPPLTPPIANQAPGRPPVVLGANANPLALNPFWNQAFLTKNWEVSALKTSDELRLGAEFHDLIVQLNLLVNQGPWLSRVEDAAEPLLKTVHRKDIHYKFFILNSDGVNAFSTPGGYIYVSRGLFDLIGEEENYALQFAVGHEIAHVDRQHAIQCLLDPDVRKLPQGTLQKLYWLILPAGYLTSEKVDQEFEADEWVANRMQQFHNTRREILIFLSKLEGYAKKHNFEDGHAKPQPDRDISMLENHYRAQTAARKRLKHLKEFMDQVAKGPK
jgi:Peptidase family M48